MKPIITEALGRTDALLIKNRKPLAQDQGVNQGASTISLFITALANQDKLQETC